MEKLQSFGGNYEQTLKNLGQAIQRSDNSKDLKGMLNRLEIT